jgi:hypothetical protein
MAHPRFLAPEDCELLPKSEILGKQALAITKTIKEGTQWQSDGPHHIRALTQTGCGRKCSLLLISNADRIVARHRPFLVPQSRKMEPSSVNDSMRLEPNGIFAHHNRIIAGHSNSSRFGKEPGQEPERKNERECHSTRRQDDIDPTILTATSCANGKQKRCNGYHRRDTGDYEK